MKRHVVPTLKILTVAFFLTAYPSAAEDKDHHNQSNAPARKVTGGSISATPDVAPSPQGGPAGPVPIPYPNVGQKDDNSRISKGVKPARKVSPEISSLSPFGCFAAGDKVTLDGKHFGAEQGERKLVLSYPVNRSRTISNASWGNERIIFTIPPGVPFDAAGKIGIQEGKSVLDDTEILFCGAVHGMPEYGGSQETRKAPGLLPKGADPGDDNFMAEGVSPEWSPPSWMTDGVVEAEKSPGEFGKMVMKKPPLMVPENQTGPPLPDPMVELVTADCTTNQRITAAITVANTSGVPTTAQAKTEVSVIAKKVRPSKSPTTVWEDVKIVLGSHTTTAGFVGHETFVIEKPVPYFGNPKYTVRAKLLTSGKDKYSSNNNKGTTISCSW